LLRSLEDIFRLGEHLGYARDNPANHYFLDTIGEDKNIFETPEYDPPFEHKYEPRL
jgi:hypothetical protein